MLKLLLNGLSTALFHVILALIISFLFFKIVFYLYQAQGIIFSERGQVACIASGMALMVSIKVFLNSSLSPR